MKEQSTLLRFNRNPLKKVLNAKRQQGLSVGLIAGAQRGFYSNSMETGVSEEKLSSLLLSTPKLKNEASVMEMLNFLQYEGDRATYSILLPYLLDATDPDELEKTICKRFFGVRLFVQYAQNLYKYLLFIKDKKEISIEKEDLQRGILAWDMGNLVCLARIAWETGYINRKTAWTYIEQASKESQIVFKNQEEINKSYLIGEAMQSDKTEDWGLSITYYTKIKETNIKL